MDNCHIFKFNTTMYQGKPSYEIFGNLHQCITTGDCSHIEIDMSEYRYMHPAFAVLVASSIYLGDKYGKEVVIRYDIHNKKLAQFLKQAGICGRYYSPKHSAQLNSKNSSIPFNRFRRIEDTYSTVQKILDCAPVNLSSELKNEFISKITEIFSNAFEHGKSDIGVFCCGFINNSNHFSFSVYDAGIGVGTNVNRYLNTHLSNEKALEWAFDKTHSTLNGIVDYPRGAGLSLLEDFTCSNHGRIDLVSENAYCRIDSKSRKFYRLKNPLQGTIVSMNIHADNRHIYRMK